MIKRGTALLICLIVFVLLGSCQMNQPDNTNNNTNTNVVAIASLVEEDKKRESTADINDKEHITNSNIEQAINISMETNNKSLVYDGTEIKFDVNILCEDIACEYGILLSINGIIHKFKTSLNDSNRYMHILNLDNRSFEIFVTPSVGSAGDTLFLSTCIIVNPSYMPESTSYKTLNNHQLISGVKIPIKYKTAAKDCDLIASSKTYKNVLSNLLNNIQLFTEDIEYSLDSEMSIVDITSFAPLSKIEISKQNEVVLNIITYGKTSDNYNLFVFQNYEPVKLLDGSDYIKTQISNEISCIQISIDVNSVNPESLLCAIAFPINEKTENDLIKSNDVILV